MGNISGSDSSTIYKFFLFLFDANEWKCICRQKVTEQPSSVRPSLSRVRFLHNFQSPHESQSNNWFSWLRVDCCTEEYLEIRPTLPLDWDELYWWYPEQFQAKVFYRFLRSRIESTWVTSSIKRWWKTLKHSSAIFCYLIFPLTTSENQEPRRHGFVEI